HDAVCVTGDLPSRVLDDVRGRIGSSFPVAHRALVDVLVDVGEYETRLVLPPACIGAYLRDGIDRSIASLGAKHRRPERGCEFGVRVSRAETPDGRWDHLGDVIADEARPTGAIEQPFERRLRERIALVAPADVRVSANEPALFDSVGPRCGHRRNPGLRAH